MMCELCIHYGVCQHEYDTSDNYSDTCVWYEEERSHGKWKELGLGLISNLYECPFCGRLINCDRQTVKLYPFCHCGAKLDGYEGGMNRDDPDYVELVENTMDELNMLSRIKGRPLYSFEINKITDKHLKRYKRKKERKP